LYNTYIVAFVLWTLMSILFLRLINSSLLHTLTSFRQWSFSLCSVTTFCLYKSVLHCSKWELISCCTSMQFWFKVRASWFFNSCTDCQKCNMMLFLKCYHMSEHFNECCNNCKWCDHAAHCFICNNDVLIVILNNKNNNDINEWVHC
jgi:hypothetical protein